MTLVVNDEVKVIVERASKSQDTEARAHMVRQLIESSENENI